MVEASYIGEQEEDLPLYESTWQHDLLLYESTWWATAWPATEWEHVLESSVKTRKWFPSAGFVSTYDTATVALELVARRISLPSVKTTCSAFATTLGFFLKRVLSKDWNHWTGPTFLCERNGTVLALHRTPIGKIWAVLKQGYNIGSVALQSNVLSN